jgi:hypothetical protein
VCSSDLPIIADGVAPKDCTKLSSNKWPLVPTKNMFYMALGDPTLNGGLMIDLTKLPAPWTEGAAGSTDNYAFWKVINWFIVDYAGRVEEADISQQFRSVEDILINALPADTVPDLLNCGAFQ